MYSLDIEFSLATMPNLFTSSSHLQLLFQLNIKDCLYVQPMNHVQPMNLVQPMNHVQPMNDVQQTTTVVSGVMPVQVRWYTFSLIERS